MTVFVFEVLPSHTKTFCRRVSSEWVSLLTVEYVRSSLPHTLRRPGHEYCTFTFTEAIEC